MVKPVFRIGKPLARLWLIGLSLVVLLLACTEEKVAGGSTSTQTGTKVNLSGRVVDKNNASVAGVVVELQRTGFKDTTDTEGRYEITGTLKDGDEAGAFRSAPSSALSPASAKAAEAGALDTLLVIRGDQELRALPVFKWVDSLPDIQIIQRDVSGRLLEVSAPIGRIEAVISGDGIPADLPLVVPLYYFALSGTYTGFAYFRNSTTVLNYVVFVRILDTSGMVMGRSPDVSFNSQAGNIPIPDFHPGNNLPQVHAGNDTALERGGIVALRGTAAAAPGRRITRLEWDSGGTGVFRVYPEGHFIRIPADTGSYPWILRAWDDFGNSARDTVVFRSYGAARCVSHDMVFYASNHYCDNHFWEADVSGVPTTMTFESGDTAIAKTFGTPPGLPVGYTGPYLPAMQYRVTVRAQGKKGMTQIRVFANRSDGVVIEYKPIFVTHK